MFLNINLDFKLRFTCVLRSVEYGVVSDDLWIMTPSMIYLV